MLGDKCWETIQPWRPSWRDTKQVRFFPKQCGHTEGVLTVSVKARCSIEVVSCGSGIFPLNFKKIALLKCPSAFRLRRLVQNAGPGISVRHFSWRFPQKLALVQCPCAFRLRRLARNMCPGISVRHFSCKLLHKLALVKCPCAFPLCRLAQRVLPSLGIGFPPPDYHQHPHQYILINTS